MPLFDELKLRSGHLWEAAQQHPFTIALAAGSLERPRFMHFLRQDYIYLVGYSRALALAAAKAPDLPRMNAFAELLQGTLTVEMELHRQYCGEYGILHGQLEAVEAAPACRAYIDFGIAAASLGGSLELLCALAPCGVGYGELGQRMLEGLRSAGLSLEGHPYRQWIETYGGQGYQTYARWMVESINDLGDGAPLRQVEALSTLFNTGCRYEWMFWEMSYSGEEWPL